MTRLILDITTNRVIYFTADLQQELTLSQHVVARDWLEEIPNGMTLNNCFNWQIDGNKLVNTASAPRKPVDLFEQNKTKVKQLLIEKINDARRPYFSKAVGGDYIRDRKLKEAQEGKGELIEQIASSQRKTTAQVCAEIIAAYRKFSYVMVRTEELKLHYEKAINDTTTESVLWAIRDEFANKNLAA